VCCLYRNSAVEVLSVFRDKTGYRVSGTTWHRLRHAAEARLVSEGQLPEGGKLTNSRADAELVVEVATRFADAMELEGVDKEEFLQRLAGNRPSTGDMWTTDELTRQLQSGTKVGAPARQPRNGRDLTDTDLLDRAGGFDPSERDEPRMTFRKLKAGISVMDLLKAAGEYQASASTAIQLAPSTPGQFIMAELRPILAAGGATRGKVTPDGITFTIGDRTKGGLAVVLRAEDPDGEVVTVTFGRWKDERRADVIAKRERVSIAQAGRMIAEKAADQLNAAA
jgi:hypothetical protein